MTKRSQQRKQEMYGYRPPEITSIAPDTASIAGIGAVGRLVATLSVTGGTAPIVYTIANAGGMSVIIAGNLLNTTGDPCGTVGAHSVSITATDSKGKTLNENLAVTVT